MTDKHKPNCSVNISCAVLHLDGVCKHFKKCDCGAESPKEEKKDQVCNFMQVGDSHCWKCHKTFPYEFEQSPHTLSCEGEIKPCKNWDGKTCEFSLPKEETHQVCHYLSHCLIHCIKPCGNPDHKPNNCPVAYLPKECNCWEDGYALFTNEKGECTHGNKVVPVSKEWEKEFDELVKTKIIYDKDTFHEELCIPTGHSRKTIEIMAKHPSIKSFISKIEAQAYERGNSENTWENRAKIVEIARQEERARIRTQAIELKHKNRMSLADSKDYRNGINDLLTTLRDNK